jgi:hypothetical protein
LTFPSGYTASYEYCSEVSRVQVIEKHLSRLTGQTLAVKVSKGTDRPAEKRADKNLNSGTAVAPNPPSRERRKAEILNDPLIQRAIEILGAQPLSVDEGFGSPARPTVPPPVASDALTDSDD